MNRPFLELVEHYCQYLLIKHDCLEVPTNLEKLAAALNVSNIDYCQMHPEASVARKGSSFQIRIRADRPRVRQRFSLAHEIGHLIIDEICNQNSAGAGARFRRVATVRDVRDLQEESLADYVAGFLLLPSTYVHACTGDSTSIYSLRRAANEADVSLAVALIRFVHLATVPTVCFLAKHFGGEAPDIRWVRQSQSVSHQRALKDLSEFGVIQRLILKGEAEHLDLNYRWSNCQVISRTFEQQTTTYGLAHVTK